MKRRESLRQPWWVSGSGNHTQAEQQQRLPRVCSYSGHICCLLVCQRQTGTSEKQHQHNVCAIWGGRDLTGQQNWGQRICSGDTGTVAICSSLCACIQGTFHDGDVEIQKAHPCQILPQLMCLGPSLACCV